MKRTPLRRRTPICQWRPQADTRSFTLAVLCRAGSMCEADTPACTIGATMAHHRKLRSQGGSNDPDNGLAVCAPCHRWIHDHPAEAYAQGWMLRATDPETPYR